MESIVVLVTCGSKKEAERLAKTVVRKRLAACVNLMASGVKSVYRWKGQVETAVEALMLIKTTRRKFGALESEIRRLHGYDTPEIIALPIVAGSEAYLSWVRNSVKP